MDRSLRRAVLERLAAVEEMAVRTVSARVARTHLKTITGGWRELLIEHQPDLTGRCPVCSGWLRRRRWPCQVWVTAHRHLIGGDGPEPARWSPKRGNPFRRPRQVEVIPRQTAASGSADQTGVDHTQIDHSALDHTALDYTDQHTDQHTDIDHSGLDEVRLDRDCAPGAEPGGIDQARTDETGTDETGTDQAGAEPFAAPAEFGTRQTTPEIHRAAIVEREPTIPRSRRNWRHWT